MKNRGFTLLELLGVIVILALLTTLVFPSVLNVIKKSSDQTDKLSMDLIRNAADLYIENNPNDFKKRNGSKYIINMNKLIEDGNLPSNITISDIDKIEEKCVQVIYVDNNYSYELKDKDTCEYFLALPEEYQQVEYIENNGPQFIDTGFLPNNSTGIDITYKALDYTSSQYIAGSREGSTGTIAYAVNGSHTRTDWDIRFDSSGIFSNVERNDDKWQTKISMIDGSGTWNLTNLDTGESSTMQLSNKSVVATTNLFLFAYNSVLAHSNLRIFGCKIYDGKMLIRDFIPCYRKSDGEIGMYDLVNDKFYTNSGTGTFVKGQDI